MTLTPLTPEQRARLHRKAELWIKLHPGMCTCWCKKCTEDDAICQMFSYSANKLVELGYWFPDLFTHCFLWMKED